MDEKKSKKKVYKVAKLIAKRDFIIFQNGYKREIKKGDDITDVPMKFLENLKTEQVI